MKYSVIDTETTGAVNNTHGNPFSQSNKLCYCGFWDGSYRDWSIDVGTSPYGPAMEDIDAQISKSPLLVGFAFKFDLHWLRRYGVSLRLDQNIWDCQAAHFILRGQKDPYPSLNEVAAHYGLGQKLDVVKTEYWDKGIDTDQIPPEIVLEYQKQDILLTDKVFQKQIEELKDKPQLKKLIWNTCQDHKVTAEMEYNGIKFNTQKSMDLGLGLEERIRQLDSRLRSFTNNIDINFNSGDQLSALLYGGTVSMDRKEEYTFYYKDPRKAPVTKTRTVADKHDFPRLVEPIKGSELKKDGFWSTSEPILKKLRAKGTAKEIIDILLERSSLDTKLSRYYFGFPKLVNEMEWADELLHTNLNHCVAETGRLSSTKPNVQNLEEEMRQCIITRF